MIDSYRHHNLGKFCQHINSLQFANHFCNLLGYSLLKWLSYTLGISLVTKNDKAQVKHILNFHTILGNYT